VTSSHACVLWLAYSPPLSLHDALPISRFPHRAVFAQDGRGGAAGADARGGTVRPRAAAARHRGHPHRAAVGGGISQGAAERRHRDRKSTRLNSSHVSISYAVFCLKKKK